MIEVVVPPESCRDLKEGDSAPPSRGVWNEVVRVVVEAGRGAIGASA